ncbi:MAG: hypothetical protein DRH08_04405, partial [Deltaproteobacteria bacterium]
LSRRTHADDGEVGVDCSHSFHEQDPALSDTGCPPPSTPMPACCQVQHDHWAEVFKGMRTTILGLREQIRELQDDESVPSKTSDSGLGESLQNPDPSAATTDPR